MRYIYTLLLCCSVSLPLIAEEVAIVVEKASGNSATFTVSADVVHLFGMSLDFNDGGYSYTATAVCKNSEVIISEEIISSKDNIKKESAEKTSIPFQNLPYVMTPANSRSIKSIRISQVKKEKTSKSQPAGSPIKTGAE